MVDTTEACQSQLRLRHVRERKRELYSALDRWKTYRGYWDPIECREHINLCNLQPPHKQDSTIPGEISLNQITTLH